MESAANRPVGITPKVVLKDGEEPCWTDPGSQGNNLGDSSPWRRG